MTIHSKAEYSKRQSRITVEAGKQQRLIHERVGLYILVWSTVESLLIGLIGSLLATTTANAQIIYTGLRTVNNRRSTIDALVRRNMQNPLRDRLLSALKAFKTETSFRNKLAHGEFANNVDGFYVFISHYDLEHAEFPNATVTNEPINQAWYDGFDDRFRRLSYLEAEFGEISDAWRASQQTTRPVDLF